jgi:cell division protein FtsB
LVAGWIIWAFAQELYLSYQLSRQAGDLRTQNAALQVSNEGYRRDIAAVSSGAAAEEEARLNGYSRSDEKLYLVSPPGSQPSRSPARTAAVGQPVDSPGQPKP